MVRLKSNLKILSWVFISLACCPAIAYAMGGGPEENMILVLVPLVVPLLALVSVWLFYPHNFLPSNG